MPTFHIGSRSSEELIPKVKGFTFIVIEMWPNIGRSPKWSPFNTSNLKNNGIYHVNVPMLLSLVSRSCWLPGTLSLTPLLHGCMPCLPDILISEVLDGPPLHSINSFLAVSRRLGALASIWDDSGDPFCVTAGTDGHRLDLLTGMLLASFS